MQSFFVIASCLVVCFFDRTDSYLNLFISQKEVSKLLGLNGSELFYVREGVVNEYAMSFIVPIPAHIPSLHFCWQALLHRQMPYAISIDYKDQYQTMKKPRFNISKNGYVPSTVQTFSVDFPCTGKVSDEIDVFIHMNVSSPSPLYNDTFLHFKRNRICLLRPVDELIPRNDSIRLASPDHLVTSSGTFYVALGSACGMIVVITAVASVLYVRNKKGRQHESMHTSYTTAAYSTPTNVFVKLETPSIFRPSSLRGSASYATIASFQKVNLAPSPSSHPGSTHPPPPPSSHVPSPRYSPSPYASTQITGHVYSQPYCPSRVSYYASSQVSHFSQATLYDPRHADSSERLRHLSVVKSRVFPLSLMYSGTFGRVYRGVFQNEDKDREDEVLVKTVSDEASPNQVSLLLAEGSMMFGMNHKNVLPILAACFDNQKKPYLVYPYINKGNLKRFLHKCRPDGEEQYTLLTQDLVDMAVQIALGMLYLHKNRICHKDISTRNCIVDEKLRVKITDNALARDIFPGDYHCLGDNENRPIKWMALESLLFNQYSGASDVWSFGVLLWELATLAQQPYIEIDPFEMAAYLRDSYRLAQPINCPDELFAVMACCWLCHPDERPNFVQLLAYLQDFYTALGKYI